MSQRNQESIQKFYLASNFRENLISAELSHDMTYKLIYVHIIIWWGGFTEQRKIKFNLFWEYIYIVHLYVN